MHPISNSLPLFQGTFLRYCFAHCTINGTFSVITTSIPVFTRFKNKHSLYKKSQRFNSSVGCVWRWTPQYWLLQSWGGKKETDLHYKTQGSLRKHVAIILSWNGNWRQGTQIWDRLSIRKSARRVSVGICEQCLNIRLLLQLSVVSP